MTCLIDEGITVCGNFVKMTKRKPKNWVDNGYRMIVEYPFKWRCKLGKVECDCKKVEESYQPYYGTSWYHSKECKMMKHLERYPGIRNLIEVDSLIAQTG